jgi:hypothetical protein
MVLSEMSFIGLRLPILVIWAKKTESRWSKHRQKIWIMLIRWYSVLKSADLTDFIDLMLSETWSDSLFEVPCAK